MIKFVNYKKLQCRPTVPHILEDFRVKEILKENPHTIEITIFGVQTFRFQTKAGLKEFITVYNQEHDHILFMKEYGHLFPNTCRYPLEEIEIDPRANYSYKK